MQDDGYDAQVFTSPCLRVRLGWLPEVQGEQPIQITAGRHPLAPAEWHIGLDDSIPTEFITALTRTLARALAETPDILFAPSGNWWAPLAQPRGWSARPAPQVSASSPDGLARYSAVTREGQGWKGWAFTAGEPSGRYRWAAKFTSTTPRVLVETFHSALTSPAPLLRDLRDIDPWVLPYLTAAPSPASPGTRMSHLPGTRAVSALWPETPPGPHR